MPTEINLDSHMLDKVLDLLQFLKSHLRQQESELKKGGSSHLLL